MRVTIGAGNSNNIDEIYITESEKLTDYLASMGCDLNWGSGSQSIMKVCYNSFAKYNRKIYGYVTPRYFFETKNLPKAKHQKFKDTFILKSHIFYDGDLYVALPGGLGTISELIAFIEEVRSNYAKIPIVIYNINHHFDSTLALFDDLKKRGFSTVSDFKFIIVIDNLSDFKKYFESNFCV